MNRTKTRTGFGASLRHWLPLSLLISVSSLLACSANDVLSSSGRALERENKTQQPSENSKDTSQQSNPLYPEPKAPRASRLQAGEMSTSKALAVLAALERFQERSLLDPLVSVEQLRIKMKQLLADIDGLAVAENLPEAELILARLADIQKKTLDIAALATETQHKGVWLLWSEKLLFTSSATRHYFSEIALNQYEKAIELNDENTFIIARERLARLIHSDHERRLVAILRRASKETKAYTSTLDLLASSGGALARLNLYQRFLTEPSVELAEAIAKAGLPRVSDLVGENAHLSDGIPFVPNTRPAILEGINGSLFRDFKDQWKELQNYFDHIRKVPSRFARSRDKWLDMHEQVESLVGLLSVDDAQKNKLKQSIVQTFRSRQSPEELVYKMNGIEFREGDIVLLQTGAVGGLWETFTRSGSMLSHLMMVTFGEDGLPYTVEMNFGRLLIAPLDLHADRFTVVRGRNLAAEERRKIRASFASLKRQNVRYDFRFNSHDSNRLYCSELAAAAFKRAQVNRKPIVFEAASDRAAELLRSAGIHDPQFYGQGSYLASPDFEVISQQIQSDPIPLIRGQLVLEAFSKHVATSSAVKLYRHPEAHQVLALSTLAQTTDDEMRRALGPQSFLYVVMTLDRLLHAVDTDAYGLQLNAERNNALSMSRISELKDAVEKSLQDTVPKHLSPVFPPGQR
ncbi:MAG: hypothetical protein FJY29_07365 [Betaproteobacteria bacterium]|nr:hypothetical protein [Betaproteobacteria bacterium]